MKGNKQASLVVISAPSGCGKDTIIEHVRQKLDNIGVSISCTTRLPRLKKDGAYEQNGVDYFFIDHSEFEERIHQHAFLEYANNKGDLYGTPLSHIEKLLNDGNDIVILNIENQGAAQVKAIDPTAVTIFIMPPNSQELYRRLVNRRSESPEQIKKRMEKGAEQMRMAYTYDYVVMNDDLETAVQAVVHIISAARHRTILHKELIDEINITFL